MSVRFSSVRWGALIASCPLMTTACGGGSDSAVSRRTPVRRSERQAAWRACGQYRGTRS
jgi:hypothetical protein